MWNVFAALWVERILVRLAFLVAVVLGLAGPTACSSVACGQDTEKAKTCYLPIATIQYEHVDLRGTDSGFTVARVPAHPSTKTRLVVSGAFPVQKPRVENLRLAVKDRAGKLYVPTTQTIAVGSGRERRVITLLCEFAIAEQGIGQVIVERRVLVGELDMGVVTAKVIIDQEEEEEKLQIKP